MGGILKDDMTLAATGDAIITREILQFEGLSDRFDGLLSLLRDSDVTVAHFESLLHEYEEGPAITPGRLHKQSSPHLVEELVGMGCDAFSTASNHSFDYGRFGIERTVEELQSRNIPFAGVGRNLYEAQRPGYLETKSGRVAILNACTSISPESEAGEQTATLPGRPGLNPLHVEQIYKLPEQQLKGLRDVSDVLGFEDRKADWIERGLYTGHDWDQEEFFHFFDLKFETVDSEAEAGIEYRSNEADEDRILDWITEAKRNADWVVMTIHAHEGAGGYRNTEQTPEFLTEFARKCIDRGADAFVGSGPHVLRGMEIYEDKPIFYSLGNFLYQSETTPRLSPKAFDLYDLDDYTKVSDVFEAWYYDDDGEPQAYLDDPRFWHGIVPECTFNSDKTLDEITIHPITLQREYRAQRGTPLLATDDEATTILDNVASLSEEFGTEIEQRGDKGIVTHG